MNSNHESFCYSTFFNKTMKVSSTAFNKDNGVFADSKTPPLPLVPEETKEELTSENSATFQLRSTPTNPDSPKYKFAVRILKGTETPREMIKWFTATNKVIHGLNITGYADGVAIAETLLESTALMLFQKSLTDQKTERQRYRLETAPDDATRATIRTNGVQHADNEEVRHITEAMRHVMAQSLPRHLLPKIKRHLRRQCRKPFGMKVRAYYQHLLRINLDELPNLPPYRGNQSFGTDEFMDIILFGTPRSWQTEMERQGFDPLDNNVQTVIDFMERIESAEEHDNTSTKVKSDKDKTTSNKKQKSSDKKAGDNNNNGQKCCAIHGYNRAHTTENCILIKREAERVKKEKKGRDDDTSKNKGSDGKSWAKKAATNKEATKKDLSAYIQKEVAKGIKVGLQKELAAFDKKRKADDASDSDGELHAFDLKDFNYEEMENLKIDDDDDGDISV